MSNVLKINIHDKIEVRELLGLKKKGETVEIYKRGDRPPNTAYSTKLAESGDIDYNAAVALFSIQDRDYDFMNQAAFLCALAIEKYLKAFLFWNSPQHYPKLSGKQILKEFSKILSHNLVKTLNECAKDSNDFNKFGAQVANINKYSLLKYPDVEDELVYSNEGLYIGSEILNDVKQVGDFVKGLIV